MPLKFDRISPMRDNLAMTNHTAETSALNLGLPWDNAFFRLGEAFYTPLQPTPVPAPYWVARSAHAAALLGIPPALMDSPELLQALSGNRALDGAQPLASVYSGHQFGAWAGQLGDGRAILLGEASGQEIQLKGAGLTPYSRMGDGRAVLRSSIREFLGSEAMAGLGIATSRALSVTGSDLPVRREELETAAVLTRLAPTFIRFGHFEHFCHTDQHAQLKQLADYVIDRFYPQCRRDTAFEGNPYASLLRDVTTRTAEMVAQWQAVGFCHGVMNTDNMSILGLTIDYGPFQFLDAYDPGHICNHSDHQGRYAFSKQPNVAYWNLFALGQALQPLIEKQDLAIAALETYKLAYPQAFARKMAAKLGFENAQVPHHALAQDALKLLAAGAVDYTIFWRRLSHWTQEQRLDDRSVRDLFLDPLGIDAWLLQYSELLTLVPSAQNTDLMLKTNPQFVLRNHLGEVAIQAAQRKDYSEVQMLLSLLEKPYDEHPEHASYAAFPPDWAQSISISCSS
jgi:uncharacterized protein YdiU (UPF0061 family)